MRNLNTTEVTTRGGAAESGRLQWVQKLLEDPKFDKAVREASVKDAAHVAVDILTVRSPQA